jgi:Calx-beta domain
LTYAYQRGVTRVIDLPNIANPATKTGLDIGAVEMVGVSVANATANEAAGTLDFVVAVSHAIPVGLTVTVQIQTADLVGSALAGLDYTAITNQAVTFTSSDALSKTISVTIANDSLD